MLKVIKWVGLIGIVVVLALFMKRTGHPTSAGWSWRQYPKEHWHWHLETGCLLDDSGMFDVHRGPYISGRWYRFGPVAIQHRWHLQTAVTNFPLQTKTIRVF